MAATAPAPGVGLPRDGVRIAEAPGLRVSFAPGADRDAAVAQAAAILQREGVVVLDDLIDPALLEACRQELVALYPDYDRPDRERYLGSYPGRHTVPLVIGGKLAERELFASPILRQIDAALMGREVILESLGLLVSIPGAPDQGRHPDGLLFEETRLDPLLPPAALSIAIPLVALDAVSGTTAFWTRSHRGRPSDVPPDFAPAVAVGSAVIWDFRLHHSGRGNQGAAARPILFAVHSRNWWQEPSRAWANRYRKLQVARAVHDGFGRGLRDFTVRADIVD